MITEYELLHIEHMAEHSLHLRRDASKIVARLIAEVRSAQSCSLRPANGFFRVSSEMLRELFQLPDQIGIVGVEVDHTRRDFIISVRDKGFPDEAAVEYALAYSSVPMDRRLKNIVRVTEVARPTE